MTLRTKFSNSLLAAACLLVVNGQADAQKLWALNPKLPEQKHASTAVYSTSQRFLVAGMTKGDNVRVAQWGDDVDSRLQGLVGMRLDINFPTICRILGETNKTHGSIHIVKNQGWAHGRLMQQLRIYEPDAAPREDVLEGFCWLMLNRFPIERQDRLQRMRRLSSFPDWLAVGVAQNLFPSLRSRNNLLLLKHWERVPSFEKIMSYDYLPEGRWLEKAACGAAVEWLHATDQLTGFFSAATKRVVTHKEITLDWTLEQLDSVASLKELEKSWDLWIASQSLKRRSWG